MGTLRPKGPPALLNLNPINSRLAVNHSIIYSALSQHIAF